MLYPVEAYDLHPSASDLCFPIGTSNTRIHTGLTVEQTEGILLYLGNRKQNTDDFNHETSIRW